MPEPSTVVIDCDPGIDDALAIALALASPEIRLVALTTVAGNAPLHVTTENALRILSFLDADHVPVAAGAERALVRAAGYDATSAHGANGLGGVSLPQSPVAARNMHAVELLADVLTQSSPRSVTIAATAPLTNLALLAALHPELLSRVSRLVVMGGSTDDGNVTPVAEFNTWKDPEAAHRVLVEAGLEIVLVGLNVTRRATIDETHLSLWRTKSERLRVFADMVSGYGDLGPHGWPLHDVLAIASIIDPSVVRTRHAKLEVDTSGGGGRGQTVYQYLSTPHADAGQVQVATEVNVERFRDMLLDRIT